MEIVTGSTGSVHVTPIDDAVRNGNVGYLNSRVVFTCFRNFEARAITANEVRVYSGYGMNQGRYFKIDENEWDSVTIENGSSGYKRADLIVAKYTMNTQTGFEDISLDVIKGASGNDYVTPSYTSGNINSGDTLDEMPLYRVRLNGLVIEGVDQLFTLVPDGGRLGLLESNVQNHFNAFNALNIRTNLASEGAVYLKNGANARPGVEGILGATHGGTGNNTLNGSANALNNALNENGTTPGDDNYYLGTSPGSNTVYHKKPFSALWDYIRGKVRTLLGMNATDVVSIVHGGTGKTGFTNGKVPVGNTSGGLDELGIDSAPSNTSNNLITSKGVADALTEKGYGDMLRSTYDPNQDGIIAPAQGGTGCTSLQATRNAMGLGNTTGVLPVANGGTGQSSLQATRNAMGLGNTTGALPEANGGTGQTSLQATRNAMGLGNTTGALPIANGGTGATTAAAARNNLGLGNTTGALPAANGGTGQTSLQATRNAMGLGNTTGALPVANGGTGATSVAAARSALDTPPTNHASTATSYGVGTASSFGHLKITDTPTSSHTAGAGVAASGKAIVEANTTLYNVLHNEVNALDYKIGLKMPTAGGVFSGNVQILNGTSTSDLSLGGAGKAIGRLTFYQKASSYHVYVYADATLTNSRTQRLPDTGGTIQVGSGSSRRIKKNIANMTEEQAKKLLDIEIVKFDYKDNFCGGLKDQSGVIVEEVIDIIPEAVFVYDGYDETRPIDEKTNPSPEVDYRKFIPYLIKMVQMQQKEIEELKAALNK